MRESESERNDRARLSMSWSPVARMAAIYPVNPCKAIIQGCRAQLRENGRVFVGHVGILPRECDSWSDQKLERKAEKILHVKITKVETE